MKQWLLPGPSISPADAPITATPVVSGLSTGVTACGMFLSTMTAALISASASAADVASFASLAFSKLDPGGLGIAHMWKEKDWEGVSLRASEQSGAIMDEFYRELERAQKDINYVLQVTADVASTIRDMEDEVPWFRRVRAAIWDSELKRQKRVCQRTFGILADMVEHANSTRPRLREQVNVLNILFEEMLEDEGSVGNPGKLLRKGISRLNRKFDPARAGWVFEGQGQEPRATEVGENGEGPAAALVVPTSPEQASFVKDLHTAQGAGSMVRGAFENTGKRLAKLLEMINAEEKLTTSTGKGFSRIGGRLDKAEAKSELKPILDEALSLAEKWRDEIQELLYAPGNQMAGDGR
ncbi:hypothetical protein C8A00DRAFT_35171 [Chaetomidium leptoderma]|uniref:Uncharacterized protein n=1 Tax=Chaetomidium leptoderma TaxID=669021 RepID=A0AAN6VIF2_9PEZI|nr:hypothetical protein C8A00DRAFT_35171 [Chaetomidium leptoderma]